MVATKEPQADRIIIEAATPRDADSIEAVRVGKLESGQIVRITGRIRRIGPCNLEVGGMVELNRRELSGRDKCGGLLLRPWDDVQAMFEELTGEEISRARCWQIGQDALKKLVALSEMLEDEYR